MPTAFRIVCSMLLLLPQIAAAHPAHDLAVSAVDGLLHPLTGIDHVLAMLAAGMWASQLDKRAALAFPVAFTFAMLLGAGLSVLGIGLPGLEPMIALSVMVFGVAIAARVRVNAMFGAALVAAFAIFHGYAHANEATGLPIPFAIGFSIATMSLSCVGAYIGGCLRSRKSSATRVAGALIGASGALLLVGI